MKFEEPELKTSFTVPDALTVRQQMIYRGAIGARAGQEIFIRAWEAGQPLIEDWQSEIVPDLKTFDLDTATDPRAATLAQWAGIEIMNHVLTLEHVAKN